jgi:hypothetical protein
MWLLWLMNPNHNQKSFVHHAVHPHLHLPCLHTMFAITFVLTNTHDVLRYACRFPAMIADWRAQWSAASDTDPTFPFGFVQLAPWGNPTSGVGDTSDAVSIVRFGQTANVGMVRKHANNHSFIHFSLKKSASVSS